MDYFTQLEQLEHQLTIYKSYLKWLPVIIGVIVFLGVLLRFNLDGKKDTISGQISDLKESRQEKINQLQFSVSLFDGTYFERIEFAKTIINNDPLLSGFDFSENINKLKNLKEPNIQQALSFYISTEYNKALLVFESLLTSTNDTFELAVINSFIGNIYLFKTEPNLKKAYRHFAMAENKYNQLNRGDELFLFNKGELLSDFGIYYKKIGDFEKAKQYYSESIIIFEDLNKLFPDKYDFMLGKLNQNFYVMYSDTDNLILAKPFLDKAIKYKSKNPIYNIEDVVLLLSSITSAGNFFTKTKEFEKANNFLEQGLKLIESCKANNVSDDRIDSAKAYILVNLSNLYNQKFESSITKDLNLIHTAIGYQNDALNIFNDIISSGGYFDALFLSMAHYGFGNTKRILAEYPDAEAEYKLSIKILEQYFPELIKTKGKYSTRLAHSYYSLSTLYFYNSNNKKNAKGYAQKALKLYNLNKTDNTSLQQWIDEVNFIIKNIG